ncbi:MAG: hypothetical protein IPP17_06815 [Bacteroidetes bacterium]|nr:hypothetical protein [Bacteroidota bacterium]
MRVFDCGTVNRRMVGSLDGGTILQWNRGTMQRCDRAIVEQWKRAITEQWNRAIVKQFDRAETGHAHVSTRSTNYPLASLITHWRSFFKGIACANYVQETPFRDASQLLRNSQLASLNPSAFSILNSTTV